MDRTTPSLYVIYAAGHAIADRLRDATSRPWTAPKDARPGDVALFYFGGDQAGIHGIGRTASKASVGIPDPEWTDSATGYFASHSDIQRLQEPLTLRRIREEFPDWGRWKALRGVRVHIVPEERRVPFASLITAADPTARSLLAPWLGGTPDEAVARAPRPTVSVRRQLRDSVFARRVRTASHGLCSACTGRTDYEVLGILEAAHIRPVADGGQDELANALPLCPNHHALLDEGKWTVKERRIVVNRDLPRAVAATFGTELRCPWDLDPRNATWHNQIVFRA